MLSFAGMVHPAAAQDLASRQKQVVVFWLHGGVSQLETWDPKPGTDTGGPFLPIDTTVPGIQICELLPYTAQQMHHLSIVRSLNTAEDDHGKGALIMETGRRETPGFEYPYLGSAFSSLLTPEDRPLPGYISIGAGGGSRDSAFLGPRHIPLNLGDGGEPPYLARMGHLTAEADAARRNLRSQLSASFALGRRAADAEAYSASFDQSASLMAQRQIFDLSTVSDADWERYGGKHPFATRCVQALKLIEAGVTFVKVGHSNYDTHSENFNFHIEQLGEFDRPFATFVADLADRGLLEHTMVIVMCEFGRTPRINHKIGRDHWSAAWSVALGGAGIKPGVVVGRTNANGTAVEDRQVNAGHLFHTYYRAVGLNPRDDFWHNGRPFAKADPETDAIEELLA